MIRHECKILLTHIEWVDAWGLYGNEHAGVQHLRDQHRFHRGGVEIFWTQGLIVAQNLSDKTFSHCMSFHFIACHSTLSIKWCFRSFCFILNAFCVLTELALYIWVFLGSEVAMWLHWFHCGQLTGDAIVTDMLFVSVERFREAGTVTMWDRMRLVVTDVAGHPANAHFERRAFVCPTLCFACLACRTPGCHA